MHFTELVWSFGSVLLYAGDDEICYGEGRYMRAYERSCCYIFDRVRIHLTI